MRVLSPGLLLCLVTASSAYAAETVEILRDNFGTPHIFARTSAGAAYGAGYAQAEDRKDALLRNLRSAVAADQPALSPRMQRIVEAFAMPTFAFQVSGEYAMIVAAAQNGWIDGDSAILESLGAFKRAGCAGVITYFAPKAARMLGA